MKIQPTPAITKRYHATSEAKLAHKLATLHCDADIEELFKRPSERKLDIKV